jgi:monofunctional glycosyltransferase
MLRKLLIVLLIIPLLAIAAGRFLPMPSTLMLVGWLTGAPVTRHWRPLSEISPHLIRAVLTAEDQRFCQHWGVDFDVLREVISDPEGPGRGGSTLTMQTVKNLYLWHGRSYVRKAIEIPLALVADLAWGKRRVLELYLNIAEWGEGVYGVEAAARAHLGKSATQVTAVEAARLAVMLPNPRERTADGATAASRRVFRQRDAIMPQTTCVLK